MKNVSSRRAALRAIHDVSERGMTPKHALDPAAAHLDERDRAFAAELVYGVVRYRDSLDWLLKGFLRRPGGLGPNTLDNLRMAVYQIEFMRVPEWAAVNEAVLIEKRDGKPAVVNAVLRNYLRNKPQLPPADLDNAETIAIRTSHPLWLVDRWMKRFGNAEASALCEANNMQAATVLRFASVERRNEALGTLNASGIDAAPARLVPCGLVLPDGAKFDELAAILPFPYFVQDEAAQLVGLLLNPSHGQRALDLCAAPGGKTTHLAELMRDAGEVVAVDRDEARAGLICENTKRLGLTSVDVRIADATVFSDEKGFDHVLVDAPCSALGTIRRNPDVKYRHTPSDLRRLQRAQLRILKNAGRLARSGGTLVYAVCSTEPEEGEEVIRGFLQHHRNFSIIEGEFAAFAGLRVCDALGFVGYRTFPHRDGMDGFFCSRLKRES